MTTDYVPPVRLLTAYRYKDDEFIMVVAEIKVPLSVFKPSGDGTIADPNDLGVTDDGHALRLGNYEAAGDAILEAVVNKEICYLCGSEKNNSRHNHLSPLWTHEYVPPKRKV